MLVDELNLKANIIHCKRLGKHIASKIRPMLVTFDSVECAAACMEKAKLLRKSTNDSVREHVHINRDLTKAQAQAAYEMRCRRRDAMTKRRDKDPNTVIEDDGSSATFAMNDCVLNPSAFAFQPSGGLSEN